MEVEEFNLIPIVTLKPGRTNATVKADGSSWFRLESCTQAFLGPGGGHKGLFQSCSSPAALSSQKVNLSQPFPSEGH